MAGLNVGILVLWRSWLAAWQALGSRKSLYLLDISTALIQGGCLTYNRGRLWGNQGGGGDRCRVQRGRRKEGASERGILKVGTREVGAGPVSRRGATGIGDGRCGEVLTLKGPRYLDRSDSFGEILALLAHKQEVGDRLAALDIFGAVPLHLPPYRFLGAGGRGEYIARVVLGVLVPFLSCLRSPFILFFLGHPIPAVANDTANVAVVAFNGRADLPLFPESRAEYHEGIARARNALFRGFVR